MLEALRQSRVCLEDGPAALVLFHKGRRVPVRVEKAGDRLKITTGRVFRRTVEVPLAGPGSPFL
ncbi:MAG: hypothetical protein ACLRS7_13255 [Acutalibacter sp.]